MKALQDHADKITEKDIYFELQQKGASRIGAARIIYFTQEAKDFFAEHRYMEPKHIFFDAGDVHNKETKDDILDISRNILNNFTRKFQEEWKKMEATGDYSKTNYIDIVMEEQSKPPSN